MRLRVAIGLSALVLLTGFTATGPAAAGQQESTNYTVLGIDEPQELDLVRRTGAIAGPIEHGRLFVRANATQAKAIERLGFKVLKREPVTRGASGLATGFPPADAAYHDYDEMSAALTALETTYPSLASKFDLGNSYKGLKIYAIKISDNVNVNENEPEILVNANMHAREHLSAEMALYLAKMLTSEYGSNARVKNIVDSREIWIIPMLNPDGVQYDISTNGSPYRWQRKNCQPICDKPDPNDETNEKGIDLNRNFGFQWGSISGELGSSNNPLYSDYRGASAFESTENKVLRDFVLSRVENGVQQIKVALDLHSYGELLMWPFGFTMEATDGSFMTSDDNTAFKALGTAMAGTNGYFAGQSNHLYPSDGDITDWYWGDQKIFAFTLEMYPRDDWIAFYPPGKDELITAETTRNREAFLLLAGFADCPYRAIGKENAYCKAANDFSLANAPASASVAQGGSVATTVTSSIVTGAVQNMNLSATGMPAGVTVGFGAATIASNASTSVTFNVAATALPGVYPITIVGTGTDTIRTAKYTLTVTGNPACTKTNATVVNLRRAGIARSPITIADCAGNGNRFSRVEVKISHTFVGQLRVYLEAPSGNRYILHDLEGYTFKSIDRSYLVDLSRETSNGIWKLAVDNTGMDAGKILSWTLTL